MILVYVLVGLFLTLAALWILIPALYGLPSVPTRHDRVRAALRLADLKPGEAFFDLGCGDGRTLVIAAREFGANATGIEIGPVQCLVSWGNAARNGVRSKACAERSRSIRVKRGNFYTADVRAADVVFVYATTRELSRLQAHLESQLRDGARVVTVGSNFPDWEPVNVDRENLIFLYVMPQYRRTVEPAEVLP
ncbi:MAG: SAM-dependent methyltransferase [Chloroflexota bacterium]